MFFLVIDPDMWGLKYGENAVIEDDWFIMSELVASLITTH